MILILTLCSFLLLLCILGTIYFIDEWRFRKLAPHVNSYRSQRRLLMKSLEIQDGKSILDLGCGDGKILRFFVRQKGCSR